MVLGHQVDQPYLSLATWSDLLCSFEKTQMPRSHSLVFIHSVLELGNLNLYTVPQGILMCSQD